MNSQRTALGRFAKGARVQLTHGLSKTRTYKLWKKMKERCYCKSHNRYHRYGGRGIRVCEDWLTFENFFSDMGECPPDYSLERINNDGNYERTNCEWIPRSKQALNRKSTIWVNDGSERVTFTEWVRRHGKMSYDRLRFFYKSGVSLEELKHYPIGKEPKVMQDPPSGPMY